MTNKKKHIFWFEEDLELLKDYYNSLLDVFDVTFGASLDLVKQKRHVDLLILDIMIHQKSIVLNGKEIENLTYGEPSWDTTGMEFLSRVREGEYKVFGFNKNVPVVIYSCRSEFTIRERAKELKVSAFLEKPVSIDKFIGTVTGVLDGTYTEKSKP